MKIALFGGTFDPIHVGHLLIAEAALSQGPVDRVLFLPTHLPVHKDKPLADSRHRLAMVRKAIRGNAAFGVSDWEIRQRRKIYTVEVLAYFRRTLPRDDLHFIIGSDSLRDIPKWRSGTALLDQATFLVAERSDVPWTSLPLALRRRVKRLPWPAVPFASHLLRNDVAAGRSIRYQVPEAVATYIQRRRLYKRQ